MKTRHLVDPELVSSLDSRPGLQLTDESLPAIRRAFNDAPPLHAPEAPGIKREEVVVPSRGGAPPVRVLVYRPTSTRAGERVPAVLHAHGGGYVIGKPEISDARNRRLAADIGCVVVSVDYRLAPETPFPGPVEDCYTGLLWLHAHADALAVDATRIAVKGESAGGGLAAAVALLARDRQKVAVCFQHLVYPMIDDRTGSLGEPNPHPYAGEFVWTPAANRFGWQATLGREARQGDDVCPYCAPARAPDLTGLPATFLQVGALDLFVDENLEYARRLLRAGVPTELRVYPGAFHGFDMVAIPGSRVQAAFFRDAHEALCRALKG
jgi:acetyl esterase/lipase